MVMREDAVTLSIMINSGAFAHQESTGQSSRLTWSGHSLYTRRSRELLRMSRPWRFSVDAVTLVQRSSNLSVILQLLDLVSSNEVVHKIRRALDERVNVSD
jgi:hypothetical protein